MDFDNIGNLSSSTRSSDQQKKTASSNNNFASFSETLEEMRKTKQSSAKYGQCEKNCREEQKEDWEKEWDIEQKRLQRERKISDREAEQRKQAASYRAAKRMKLLEYARYLKETSIQRAEEERQRIAGREEKDIEKKRYRAKTVHIPVSHIGHTGNVFEDIFLR